MHSTAGRKICNVRLILFFSFNDENNLLSMLLLLSETNSIPLPRNSKPKETSNQLSRLLSFVMGLTLCTKYTQNKATLCKRQRYSGKYSAVAGDDEVVPTTRF